MKFQKIFVFLALILNIINFSCINALACEKKYTIQTPDNLEVHSVCGIYSNKIFIFAYQAAEMVYNSGCKPCHEIKNQKIYITNGTTEKWNKPFMVASAEEINEPEKLCFDPVLFEFKDTIFLFYKIGKNPRNLAGYAKISKDNGRTWSKPTPLPKNIFGPAKCKPLLSEDNNYLICGSSFQKGTSSDDQYGKISVDILDFETVIWNGGKILTYNNKEYEESKTVIIQPAIWKDSSKKLHMLCRTNTGYLAYSNSDDDGKTWSTLINSNLFSNYSAIDILKITNNRVFMAWNPLNVRLRNKLVISELINEKNPEDYPSWEEKLILEYNDQDLKNEYSFPSIIFCENDTRLFVAYGINHKQLILAEVNIL